MPSELVTSQVRPKQQPLAAFYVPPEKRGAGALDFIYILIYNRAVARNKLQKERPLYG